MIEYGITPSYLLFFFKPCLPIGIRGKDKHINPYPERNHLPPTIVKNPTKYKEKVVGKLEDALRDGADIGTACKLAKIDRSTYYSWLASKPEFLQRMTDAKEWITEIARSVVARSITKKNDTNTAKWWLERKNKQEFSQRQELTGADGNDLAGLVIIKHSEEPKK